MKLEETKLTRKHQTTIPKEIRKHLDVKPGQSVRWHVVKGMVVVDVHKEMDEPVKFLTSQIQLDLDAVALVKKTREEF
ncbi:MAG: AbrB/MazE/SpoVT family DNA-binding domain-containing protein [Thaumarchaeota archaeon]|nr:AbrB/MazE/SpoVT family DNA-binding domain-containing protein [Nitrososphaerota archaeon]